MMLSELKQYKTDTSEEEIWKLLNKHCKDALGELPIVRGMKPFKNGYGIIHGAAGERMSANTSNHYTLILDGVLPKEYPRRGKSIICANWKNRKYAAGYGTLHAIIPFDDVTIGVCPERDIFGTEITLGTQTRPIYRWNYFYSDNEIGAKSFPQIVKDFKALLDRRDLWGLEAETIKETLVKAYTKPFKVATTASAEIYNDGAQHELWIGGKCIAIDLMLYRSVMRNAKGSIK